MSHVSNRQDPLVRHLAERYGEPIPVDVISIVLRNRRTHRGPITIEIVDEWLSGKEIRPDAPYVPELRPEYDRPSGSRIHRNRYSTREPMVYYVRFGDRVKIGTSTDVRKRIRALPCEELLATEPGWYGLESQRHAQFRDLRVVGEWFRYEGALRDHIETLRPARPRR